MKQYLMAAACAAALCASAPAFAQSSPGANPASPSATSPASPSATPSTNGGCLPGQILDASGNPCPSTSPSSSAQNVSPSAGSSSTAQGPATPSGPSTPPAATAQAPSPAPSAQVASSGANFISQQTDSQMLASNLMGKNVQDSAGNKIGSVKDILFDDQGKMAAIVIGVGGFLGIGEKSVAISFDQVMPGKDANGNLIVTASLDKDTINAAPDFMTLDDLKAKTPSNAPPASSPSAPRRSRSHPPTAPAQRTR